MLHVVSALSSVRLLSIPSTSAGHAGGTAQRPTHLASLLPVRVPQSIFQVLHITPFANESPRPRALWLRLPADVALLLVLGKVCNLLRVQFVMHNNRLSQIFWFPLTCVPEEGESKFSKECFWTKNQAPCRTALSLGRAQWGGRTRGMITWLSVNKGIGGASNTYCQLPSVLRHVLEECRLGTLGALLQRNRNV